MPWSMAIASRSPRPPSRSTRSSASAGCRSTWRTTTWATSGGRMRGGSCPPPSGGVPDGPCHYPPVACLKRPAVRGREAGASRRRHSSAAGRGAAHPEAPCGGNPRATPHEECGRGLRRHLEDPRHGSLGRAELGHGTRDLEGLDGRGVPRVQDAAGGGQHHPHRHRYRRHDHGCGLEWELRPPHAEGEYRDLPHGGRCALGRSHDRLGPHDAPDGGERQRFALVGPVNYQTAVPADLGQMGIPTSVAILYTVPLATRTFLKDIDIANNTGADIRVTVYKVPPGGTVDPLGNVLIPNMTVPTYGVLQWEGVQILLPGGRIEVVASAIGCTISASGA